MGNPYSSDQQRECASIKVDMNRFIFLAGVTKGAEASVRSPAFFFVPGPFARLSRFQDRIRSVSRMIRFVWLETASYDNSFIAKLSERLHLEDRERSMRKLVACSVIIIGLVCFNTVHLDLANAETVDVKDRGPVDLSHFKCESITGSPSIERLCYDAKENYVLVKLRDGYYHHCGVPASVVADWRKAESMGRFYSFYVKWVFDCRESRVPSY